MDSAADDDNRSLMGAVDLNRYPLHRTQSKALQQVVERCRAELHDSGCSILDGFFAPGIEAMQREAALLAPRAYFKERYGNPYSTPDDPALPRCHPVRTFLKRNQGFVAGDLIDERGTLKRVYRDARFRGFISNCLGLEEIHEYADPLGCLVVNVIRNGAQHPWHFDTNEFVVSTLVQAPQSGGHFEYCPHIRSSERENFENVGRVLHGEDRTVVRSLRLRPGDVQLFRGRYSLHRVTPVRGSKPRLSVIFAYTEQPGVIGQLERTKHLFGRVTESHCRQPGRVHRPDALID